MEIMEPSQGQNPDLLILTFPAGSSFTRWDRFGVIDRELPFIRGLAAAVPRILFLSIDGKHDARLAKELSHAVRDTSPESALDGLPRIDSIAERYPDANLGADRTLEERVLARIGTARNIVIQTMQFDDAGIASRLLSPIRRIGRNVALVARGSFIDSRVLSSTLGPHHFKTLSLGAAEQQICSAAQIVVGSSESMIDELCWKNGISPRRARIIAQHVPANPFKAERDAGLLVTSGRFNGECQQFRNAIEAVGALSPEQRSNVRLEILGDGPDGHDLPAFAESLGVETIITRGPTHAEIQATLARASVYIQTEGSRRQSHTVLQAMAAGCPVIVTDLPEYNGLIENGSTGIRVNSEARGFSFAIDCLLSDSMFRNMLGDAARDRIKQRCSIDRTLGKMLACYRDALLAAPQRGEILEKRAS